MSSTTIAPPKPVYLTECREGKEFDIPRNVHLEITVDHDEARFECGPSVSVGPHKNRGVTFRANEACILVFSNEKVFGRKEQTLEAMEAKTLFIDEGAIQKDNDFLNGRKPWTHCSVKPIDGSREVPENFQSPPKIEVP